MSGKGPFQGGLRACALARLEAIKTKGLKLYGIETRGEGPPKLRFPTQLSDLYGVMKALKAKGQNQSSAESAQFSAQSLKTSLANPLADVVMMTTARMGHLEDNAITAGLIP